ncbi:hypothetical protein [Ornithinibacillus sp. JPR2-1]|uniref:hypothetical protein n=1 Tax=Ornithinibacillus sp. JPR2-1 TaxID=2094019 RepID=UPI0031D72FE4
MSFEFDDSDFLSHLSVKELNVIDGEKKSMGDAVDDLGRISSEIAPIKSSVLRKTMEKTVKVEGTGVVGEVAFSASESSSKGRFNYALWTHEMDYELGEQSAKSPGTDGYEVGNKYLERPLKGESEKYIKWLADGIAGVMDGK